VGDGKVEGRVVKDNECNLNVSVEEQILANNVMISPKECPMYLLSNKFMSSTHTESQTRLRRVYEYLTKSLNIGGSVSPFPNHCFPLPPSPSTPLPRPSPFAQATSSPVN
jgi:hypothetical protein